jgi:hypothetical protein
MLKAKKMKLLDYIYTIYTPTNCCSQRITQIPLLLWSVVVRYLYAPTCIDQIKSNQIIFIDLKIQAKDYHQYRT